MKRIAVGRMDVNDPRARLVREVRVDGRVVDGVFDLDDEQGWVLRYTGEIAPNGVQLEVERVSGEVEVVMTMGER